MSLFLGVDGGGTKTAFALVDSAGVVRGRAQEPTTYYLGSGIELVGRILGEGVAEVCRQAGVTPADIRSAFFGLPGYGEISTDVARLDAVPAAVLGHDRYRCDNDMVAGWAGSLGTEDGINVIAGTGSMAYGERDGAKRRVGGWGELFGDEGSGYWIGLHGLNAFSRMSDGRLPRGPLHALVRERAGASTDLDVIDVVFNHWGKSRTAIAALSRTVTDADGQGDVVAAEILQTAGRRLAELVGAARTALGFPAGERVPVSYSGGVFTAPQVLGSFTAALGEGSPDYELREPLFEPVVGAALYAAKLAGNPLPREALAAL